MLTKPDDVSSQAHETNRDNNQIQNFPDEDQKTGVAGDPSVRKVIASELLAAILSENREIQQRARQLFIEHGYFDEAVRHLREAQDASDRVAAAQKLGQFGSNLANAALNAALFDDEIIVREAAQAAIDRIGGPPMAKANIPNPSASHQGSETGREMLEDPELKSVATQSISDPDEHGPSADVSEITNLLLEENALRARLDGLEAHLLELGLALESARKEARSASEAVLKYGAEIDDLGRQEELIVRQIRTANDHYKAELRKKTEAEQDRQRFSEELIHVRSEADRVIDAVLQVTRKRTEMSDARRFETESARRIADELYNVEVEKLRSEEAALRQVAEKAALRRAEVREARRVLQEQTTQLLEQQNGPNAPEAARLAEVERLHYETEERHRSEQEQLRLAVDKLKQVTQHVAARRAGIEFAARVAEAEAEKLAKAQAKLDAAEEIHHTTESRRLRSEAVPDEGIAEYEPSAGEVEIEQNLNNEIERLEEAEIDIRRRIEQAELRRRGAEDACRQLEERAIKVEAEAHRSQIKEEQALAKLETARREAAAEFQSRSEQQKQIREEIEELRRLELEERRRVEEESMRRSQVETRLQQERERFKVEEAVRQRAEAVESELIDKFESAPADETRLGDDPGKNLKRNESAVNKTSLAVIKQDDPEEVVTEVHDELPAELLSAFRSHDAQQRSSALAELAGIGTHLALTTIVEAFDDELPEVRSAAALALHKGDSEGAGEWFTKAFESGPPERQRNIGQAIVESGLALDSITNLTGSNFDETHNALSLLLIMARAGEVQPLIDAIEEHKNLEVRRAAIRLLTLSGHAEVADTAVKRRLAGI